ncbi:MAG: ABC transporter ATP-binding protein [Acidimicrobiia bacterium]
MEVDRPTTWLEARSVAVGHGAGPVLSDASLLVAPGTTTAIVGANGSGKSTLLRALAGVAKAQQGHILLEGRPLDSCRPREVARRVAHLPQAPLVPAGMTVEELVALGRHPHRRLVGAATASDSRAVEHAVDATGIGAFRRRQVAELSGGERQRVWVAVALAQEAPVLLLDEPTTFLDIRHQLELLELLADLANAGRAVLVVLHDLNQAAAFADQLLVLGRGRVLAQGPPADVLHSDVISEAFEVDAHVEARGSGIVCHFRPLRTESTETTPHIQEHINA